MAHKIGFTAEFSQEGQASGTYEPRQGHIVPRKSVVQVHFADRNTSLAYYNDAFDLKVGDLVYVEGKMEGIRGRVTQLNYNFKIKVSDYRRVIALVDTHVSGEFFLAGSHFVTFDRETLPKEQAMTWFKAPDAEDVEVVTGSDDDGFFLDDLGGMKVTQAIAERGREYYMDNRVRYLCLDGNKGYALVEGSETYEVEFEFHEGQICGLLCTCFCSYNCKHEFAAMLQLRETLELICQHYAEEFDRSGYFAAIQKVALFAFAIEGKETGSFKL